MIKVRGTSGYLEDLEPEDLPLNAITNALDLLSLDDACFLHSVFFGCPRSREGILAVEKWVESLPTAHEIDYPLFHSFADGMYRREIHINAGELLIGKIHKNEYFVNLLKGKMWLISEFYAMEIEAPYSFKAPAGVKHAAYIMEDSVWVDTHKVSFDTIEEAENYIFADSYDELDEHLGVINSNIDTISDKIAIDTDNSKPAGRYTGHMAEDDNIGEYKQANIGKV